MTWKRLLLVLAVISLLVGVLPACRTEKVEEEKPVVFGPLAFDVQRFRHIVTQILRVQKGAIFESTLSVGGAATLTGAVDAASTLQFGTDNLYPMGYATTGYEIQCGTTSTFTASTSIAATALTTATYVLATQITTPAATAALLTVSDPTTTTVTLSSWEGDYTAGTTGITAHYCVVGTQ